MGTKVKRNMISTPRKVIGERNFNDKPGVRELIILRMRCGVCAGESNAVRLCTSRIGRSQMNRIMMIARTKSTAPRDMDYQSTRPTHPLSSSVKPCCVPNALQVISDVIGLAPLRSLYVSI
jgi:hypothetical protein